MPCELRPDPSDVADAIGKAGTTPILFLTPDVDVTAATQDNVRLSVDEQSKAILKPLKNGPNIVEFTIDNVSAGDNVTLMEDCGNGNTKELTTVQVGGAPGGFNPVLGFRIDGE